MALDLKSFAIGKANGGGYPEPTGSINITENGTYNVKDKAEAVVDVQGDSKYELLNDGKWHFYFDFTTESQLKGYLGIYVNSGTATIDFGDGTPLEITSGTGNTYTYHEYSALGNYRVDVEGDINVFGSPSNGAGSLLWRPYKDGVGLPTYMFFGAKYGIYALKFVEIPNSVTSIGDNAFNYCNSLQSINIPDGVTSIGGGVFSGCNSLQSITIPDGVTSIGASAFNGCNSLQSINIPGGVTSIGDGAFRDCNSLQSINIPDGVTSIGVNAFSGCNVLTGNLKIPVCMSIGNTAFYRTSLINYLFTDWTSDDITNCVFGTNIFSGINNTQKIVFATQEIAEVAKNTTNLATYASYIHYVGEEG